MLEKLRKAAADKPTFHLVTEVVIAWGYKTSRKVPPRPRAAGTPGRGELGNNW